MKTLSRPGPGQVVLPGINEAVPFERDLNARNVFSEVATPEYWNLDFEKYGDIQLPMIEAAATQKLRPYLIDIPRARDNMAVGYTPDEGNRERYVPLPPWEYRLIPRTYSPRLYGAPIMAATLSGKKSLEPSMERRQSEADEDELNAIQLKFKKVSLHIDDNLVPEKQILDRFLESATFPGLLRRKEIDTRIAASLILERTLPQALEVIGRQKGWRDEQYDLAKRSVEYRLFFMRKNNQHLTNWADTLQMLGDYNQERTNVFADRRGRLSGYLMQHGQPVQ